MREKKIQMPKPKKKPPRKAREWSLRLFPDGTFCKDTGWHFSGELIRVREILLPRNRGKR